MKTYDQLALQDYPELMISSPSLVNQGAATITLGGIPTGRGQPIIAGAPWSFHIDGASRIEIAANPLFFVEGSSFECVTYFHNQPLIEVPIVEDNDSRIGIYANQDGFILRLLFDNGTMSLPVEALINIKDWGAKYYITVVFGQDNATLSVNDKSVVLEYVFEPVAIKPTALHIGSGQITEWFLLDGVAFYQQSFTKKVAYVDDLDNGHHVYASATFQGTTTELDTYVEEWRLNVSSSEFKYVGEDAESQYNFCSVQLPQSDIDVAYLSLKSSDERITFDYSYDGGATWTSFIDSDTISPATDLKQLVIRNVVDGRYQGTDRDDFTISIAGIHNGSIEYRTPASLILTGGVVYPSRVNDSIVNCADGALLDNGYYDGTWIQTVQTIEIVFRPEVEPASGYLEIYQASDGYVRWGPGSHVISGYTAFLNGATATDTFAVRLGQWNHLVLVKTSIATTFSINKNVPGQLSIMLLGGYPKALTAADALQLYKVLYGGDNLSYVENYGVVNEAVYAETGNAYKLYSYNWAVVGSTST